MPRRTLLIAAAAFFVTSALAQTYPDRPIRLIAPFPAGGLADVLARAVGDEMRSRSASRSIVENRAGAGGNTGADAVAKAAPDGYTLLMSSAGILTANQFLYAKMPFDAGDRVHPDLDRRRHVDAARRASEGRGEEPAGIRRARRERSPASSTSARPASAPPAISASRCSCTPPT